MDDFRFRVTVFVRDEFSLLAPKVGYTLAVLSLAAVMARDTVLVQNGLDLTAEAKSPRGPVPGFYFGRPAPRGNRP